MARGSPAALTRARASSELAHDCSKLRSAVAPPFAAAGHRRRPSPPHDRAFAWYDERSAFSISICNNGRNGAHGVIGAGTMGGGMPRRSRSPGSVSRSMGRRSARRAWRRSTEPPEARREGQKPANRPVRGARPHQDGRRSIRRRRRPQIVGAITRDVAPSTHCSARHVGSQAGVIPASNTSSSPQSPRSAPRRNGRKVLGMHFMNLVLMTLVELIRGQATSVRRWRRRRDSASVSAPQSRRRTIRHCQPRVDADDQPSTADGSVGTPEAIDTVAARHGHPMGPLTLADFVASSRHHGGAHDGPAIRNAPARCCGA